jgi:hypothetical protein
VQAKETAAAAVELRKLGSTAIVLGGASIGGVTALEAAASLKPEPTAVFGFSSSSDSQPVPLQFTGSSFPSS